MGLREDAVRNIGKRPVLRGEKAKAKGSTPVSVTHKKTKT
jgi:hypothetical protein